MEGAAGRWSARPRASAGPPIRGQVIRRGAPGFCRPRTSTTSATTACCRTLVARPVDAADVRTAVSWGVAHGVPLRARSGGHSYAGYSTLSGGMVLDLRNLRGISVDVHNRTATIGAGSQLIDVYAALAARGVTIPAGSCPSVGIAGHALGGGMGLAGRKFGLDRGQRAERADRDRGRSAADREHSHQSRPLLGAARWRWRKLRRRDELHVPRRTRSRGRWRGFTVSWPWSQAADALAAWQAWASARRAARSPRSSI